MAKPAVITVSRFDYCKRIGRMGWPQRRNPETKEGQLQGIRASCTNYRARRLATGYALTEIYTLPTGAQDTSGSPHRTQGSRSSGSRGTRQAGQFGGGFMSITPPT